MSRNILTGLIGAWCPSLGPSGYTLLDRSGRGNHGTLRNTDATFWQGSRFGWSMKFDGTNDYVDFVDVPVLRLEGVSWSWAFWINPSLLSKYQAFIAHDSNVTQNPLYEIGIDNTNRLYIYNQSVIIIGSIMVADWQHCVVTGEIINATQMTVTLFQNGVSTATGTYAIFGSSRGQRLRFGVDAESGAGQSGYATASMSDIGLWARCLRSSDIRRLYEYQGGGLGRLLTQRAQRRVFRTATGNRRRRLICGAEC